ncbi:hypothetical protein D3C80_836740 [compost metagenome]
MGVGQVLLDQANAFDCDAGRHRVIQGRAKGFDVMGQGIHAGCGGQASGQAAGQHRVENHCGWQQFGVTDHAFDLLCAVGEHGFAAQLRAGARGRRQGDQFRQAKVREVRKAWVVLDDLRPFEALQAIAGDGCQADALGRVHGTAATQGDQRVVLAGLERRDATGHVLQARVAGDIAKHRERDCALLQMGLQQGHGFQGQHARVGDQQGVAHAQQCAALGQQGESVRPTENFRGVVPVVKRRHPKLQISARRKVLAPRVKDGGVSEGAIAR